MDAIATGGWPALSEPDRRSSERRTRDACTRVAQAARVGAALCTLGSLLFAFPAFSQVQTNAFVNPCINIVVINPSTGKNACVTNADGDAVQVGTSSPAGGVGTGSLTVTNGATFSPYSVDIGVLAPGNVAVSGATLNAIYFLNIGSYSPGTMTISNGSQVSAYDIDMSANESSANGMLNIMGA